MMRFVLVATVAAIGLVPNVALASEERGGTPVPANAQLDAAGIPGPRTCFWTRGPVSGDPYINVAYPDSNVFYWSARFQVPEGAKLDLEGQFPHSRYVSLISYDVKGVPVETLADYLIAPLKGHINTFETGADRNAPNRSYRVAIDKGAEGLDRAEGFLKPGVKRNILHAPPSTDAMQTLIYRIYGPDDAHTVAGGVGLPEPVLRMADGKTLKGQAACDAMGSDVLGPVRIQPGALGLPVDEYRKLRDQPGKPDTWPATVPPQWHIQLDRQSLIGIYTGKINPDARRSEGGFYPNPDNNYVRTIVNMRHGKVIVLRGKMPETPATLKGEARMGEGQLRYWSICSNQSFANTRVTDCLMDEDVPLTRDRSYVIVASKEKDRPRNARPECGIAWLKIADDGDGVSDPDVAIIQIRNMLARTDFPEAIQNVKTDGAIESVMGSYLPTSTYTMPNIVETSWPCTMKNKS